MCENFEHLSRVADELCVYRGCQVDSVDHPTACYQMNTGKRFGGDPAVGAWTTYGLGTLNQNLPAFVVGSGLTSVGFVSVLDNERPGGIVC